MNVCALSQLKDLDVSFMSGNTVEFGRAVVVADVTRSALLGGVLLGSFVAGGVLGTIVGIAAGRHRAPVVLLLVSAILAVPLAHPPLAASAFALAMGALPTALRKAGDISVNATYVTGTLVRFSRGLGELACRRATDWAWLLQATPWLGLLAGAMITAWTVHATGRPPFAALPVAALLLSAATWLVVDRLEPS